MYTDLRTRMGWNEFVVDVRGLQRLKYMCSSFKIWVRSRNCSCLVTWFCYQLIAKPGDKTAPVSWPDPYAFCKVWLSCLPNQLPTPIGVTMTLQSEWLRSKKEKFINTAKICGGSLTHWGRDKMATIFQTTFSNAFSSMKMFKFRLRFHWSGFLRVQLTILKHWFR